MDKENFQNNFEIDANGTIHLFGATLENNSGVFTLKLPEGTEYSFTKPESNAYAQIERVVREDVEKGAILKWIDLKEIVLSPEAALRLLSEEKLDPQTFIGNAEGFLETAMFGRSIREDIIEGKTGPAARGTKFLIPDNHQGYKIPIKIMSRNQMDQFYGISGAFMTVDKNGSPIK